MVEVPAIWEVVPRQGDVSALAHSSLLFLFIGVGLVLQYLQDEGRVRLRHDEDRWHLQQG